MWGLGGAEVRGITYSKRAFRKKKSAPIPQGSGGIGGKLIGHFILAGIGARLEWSDALVAAWSNLRYRTYLRDVNFRLKACNYEIMKVYLGRVHFICFAAIYGS